MTTPLGHAIRRLIAADGPITVADYMARCLADPEHGYYITRDPLGAAGDFTTAPEISQMFGEIIGAWLAFTARQAGLGAPLRLIELGPGRGTLMADILRVMQRMPDLATGLCVECVETSPALRERQRATLAGFDVATAWHDRLSAVPRGPALVVANEFFDALPVYQYVRHAGRWHERRIGLAPAESTGPQGTCAELAFVVGPPVPEFTGIDPLTAGDTPLADGAILEASPAAEAIMAELAGRIVADGGAALVIDYGYDTSDRPPAGSFQAVRHHRHADPLAEPGAADLTAHVDFAALGRAARAAGAAVHGPLRQGRFLTALGLPARAEKLKRDKSPQIAAEIDTAAIRLVGPGDDEMGTRFKAIAVTRAGTPPPPPF